MKQSHIKLTILSVSLTLHLLLVLVIFFLYQSNSADYPLWKFDASVPATPETIFYETQSPPQEIIQETSSEQEQEQWAQLKARASTLGSTMDPLDDPYGTISSTPSDEDNQPIAQPEITIKHESESQTSNLSTTFINKPTISISPQEKKIKAQQAIAKITEGYLQQLTHEGENLIKTIGGDPTKTPTAYQLQYERYMAKLQWCLHNAHMMHQEKCAQYGPVQTTVKVNFILTRSGKMIDLRVIQSSGTETVDNYIRLLFQAASTSFPPLPAFIENDPHSIIYHVMVNWR